MAAALWDLTWDLGGGWSVRLSRRDRAGVVLPLNPPCLMEVRAVDQPSSTAALLTLTGQVDDDELALDLVASPGQVATLGAGRYEHRVLLGDDPPVVFIRGYLRVRDTVGA